jgi:hypothetical protein
VSLIHRLKAWRLAHQWRRFRADNQREILRLEAEAVASGIERWGYESFSRDCRKHWATASEGKRAHWRQLAKRGF